MSILDLITALCLGIGTLACIIGGIGLIRLPDFYTRTHGASITDTLGANLIVIGLIVHELGNIGVHNWWLNPAKMFLLLVFLFLAGPAAGHALVKAAYARGVRWNEPLSPDEGRPHAN